MFIFFKKLLITILGYFWPIPQNIASYVNIPTGIHGSRNYVPFRTYKKWNLFYCANVIKSREVGHHSNYFCATKTSVH